MSFLFSNLEIFLNSVHAMWMSNHLHTISLKDKLP